MKVVLFCGGRGLRLREHSEAIPKPMVRIGYRPILWHVMRYHAHYGHRDFILCLGYRGDAIKGRSTHRRPPSANLSHRQGQRSGSCIKYQRVCRNVDNWPTLEICCG